MFDSRSTRPASGIALRSAGNHQPPRRLGRRPALDGVRGIAVLLVIAVHVGLLDSADIGVDVFFPLSGFLITALLYEESERHGALSLRRFYARRARRLLFAVALGHGLQAAAWSFPRVIGAVRSCAVFADSSGRLRPASALDLQPAGAAPRGWVLRRRRSRGRALERGGGGGGGRRLGRTGFAACRRADWPGFLRLTLLRLSTAAASRLRTADPPAPGRTVTLLP
jgi:hypothetical protein